jgi:hypothetical protein
MDCPVGTNGTAVRVRLQLPMVCGEQPVRSRPRTSGSVAASTSGRGNLASTRAPNSLGLGHFWANAALGAGPGHGAADLGQRSLVVKEAA